MNKYKYKYKIQINNKRIFGGNAFPVFFSDSCVIQFLGVLWTRIAFFLEWPLKYCYVVVGLCLRVFQKFFKWHVSFALSGYFYRCWLTGKGCIVETSLLLPVAYFFIRACLLQNIENRHGSNILLMITGTITNSCKGNFSFDVNTITQAKTLYRCFSCQQIFELLGLCALTM